MIWNVFPRWSHQKIGFKTYLKRHRMKMHDGLDFFNRQWGLQNTTGRHRNLVKPSTEKFDPQSLSPWSVGGRSGKKMSLGLISSSSNGSRNCLIEWLGDIHIYIYIIIVVHACGDPQKNWVHHFCAKWFSLSLRSGPSNSPQFASLYVGDLHPDVTEAAQPADNVWWHWRCQTFRIHENSRYVVLKII